MCSTIVQKSGPMDYMTALFSNIGRTRQASIARDDDAINARPLAIHCFGDTPAMDRFHWGYAPSWWKRRPVMNARLAALLRGSAVWRPLLGQRVLVPADGWYQPIGADPTASRYIRSLDGKPIYIAALTAWRPGNQHGEQDGLAIVTDDIADARSAGHVRPVVLPVQAALAWVDPSTPIINALELACTPWMESTFQWQPATATLQ